MIIYTIIALVFCAAFMALDYYLNNDIFSPGIWIPAAYLLFYFSAPVLLLFFGSKIIYFSPLTRWENLPQATYLNTIGLAGIFSGILIVRKESRLARLLPNFSLDIVSLKAFTVVSGMLFLVLFSFNYFAYLSRMGMHQGPITSRLNIIAGISSYFLIFVLEALRATRRKLLFYTIVGGYFVVALFFLTLGMRYRLLYLLLVLVLLRNYQTEGGHLPNYQTRKSQRRMLKYYVMIFICVVVMVSYYKHNIYPKKHLNNVSTYGVSSNIVNLIFKLDYNSVLTQELSYYDMTNFHYGKTFLYSFAGTLIPYSLTGINVGEPVQITYQEKISTDFMGGRDLGVGLDYALNAEGFINFGYIGVPLVMFIVSMTIKCFYVKYIQNRKYLLNKYQMISPYLLLVASPDILRREFSNFINVSFAMLIILWILCGTSKALKQSIRK